MHPFIFALCTLVASSLGQELLRSRNDQLKPFGIIPSLLKRADSTGCATACSDGDGCCGVAQRCCSDGGCCQISESCVTVNGVKGCCPEGSTCMTLSEQPISTTNTATTTAKYTAITSLPTLSASTHDVAVNFSALSFSGQWEAVASSCNSSATSQVVYSDGETSAENSTASLSFRGSAVFLKMSAINADYAIILDGDTTGYGGIGEATLPPNCTFGWWRDNLDSSLHEIQITVYGTGNQSSTRKEPWTVEFRSLVVTQPGSETSSSTTSSAGNSLQRLLSVLVFGIGIVYLENVM